MATPLCSQITELKSCLKVEFVCFRYPEVCPFSGLRTLQSNLDNNVLVHAGQKTIWCFALSPFRPGHRGRVFL